MLQFIVNNRTITTDCPSGMVALDFIREQLKLTGTKEGCKEGECGACTVLLGEINESGILEYHSTASCLLPIGSLNGKHIVTVEGLNFTEGLNLVQQKIFENSASQCGFCTPGIVLSLTGFLLTSDTFSYKDAVDALDGNICRCTGYYPVRKAARALSNDFIDENRKFEGRVKLLIKKKVIPEYFNDIPERLKKIYSVIFGIEGGKLVAGGTDIFVQRPDDLYKNKLTFLSELGDFDYIKKEKDYISVGANITVEKFRRSEIIHKYFPSLKDDLLLVSSTLMRNKATLTGNIVNASPIGDLTIILLSLNSELILKKENSERKVKLSKFYSGYKMFDLKCREIITEIRIPVPEYEYKFSFEKVSNRKYLDIASCNTAMLIELHNDIIKKLNISVGGVAPIPMLLNKSVQKLTEKNIKSLKLDEFLVDIESEINPIDDIRGSTEYKKLLTKQLIKAHFIKLFGNKIDGKEVVS